MYVQAGGGVVADSDPEAEFQETVNKARALMAAADEALKQSSASRLPNQPGGGLKSRQNKTTGG